LAKQRTEGNTHQIFCNAVLSINSRYDKKSISATVAVLYFEGKEWRYGAGPRRERVDVAAVTPVSGVSESVRMEIRA